MKKPISYLLTAMLAVVLSISFASCGDDDEEEDLVSSSSQARFSTTVTKYVGASGGSFQLTIVNCEPGLTVESSVEWINTQLSYMQSLCSVQVGKNSTSEQRQGIIRLIDRGQIVSSVNVIQEAGSNTGGSDTSGGSLSAPTGLTLTKDGNSVTLRWNPVSGVSDYIVYYSNPNHFSSGDYSAVKQTSNTSYTYKLSLIHI